MREWSTWKSFAICGQPILHVHAALAISRADFDHSVSSKYFGDTYVHVKGMCSDNIFEEAEVEPRLRYFRECSSPPDLGVASARCRTASVRNTAGEEKPELVSFTQGRPHLLSSARRNFSVSPTRFLH